MKKILSLLLIIILTGCTVKYDINISENSLNENIIITEDISKVNEDIVDKELEKTYSEYSNEKIIKYKTSKKKNNNDITYTLSQKYSLNKPYIRAFSECFDSYIINKDETTKNYTIKTSEGFKCLSYNYSIIDSVKLNINLKNDVIETNADESKDGIYTWNIDNTNFKDKYIYIKFKEENIKQNSNKPNKIFKNVSVDKDIIFVILLVISLFIIVGIIALLVLRINKNRNKL